MKLKIILSEIHLVLTLDREHGRVFEKVPIIGCRWTKSLRAKSLKSILVRTKLTPLKKNKGCCRSCKGFRCEICKYVAATERFRSFSTQREHCIKPNNLNCCSSNAAYLFSCKACSEQYTDSTRSFWSRFNSYKSTHRSFIKEILLNQHHFTLTLTMTNMVWVIEKLPSLMKQTV